MMLWLPPEGGDLAAEVGLEAASDPGPGPWLLALHSSGDTLGVALQRLGDGAPPRLAAFPLGRALSNDLFGCVEAVLPASRWPQLARLAVATGPGGFTGTRLTVTLARTLAQQLGLPLDGVGSFLLMARRRLAQPDCPPTPFWLVQELPRRGVVAGLYAPDPEQRGGGLELAAPRLYREPAALAEVEASLFIGPDGEGLSPPPAVRCPAQVHQPPDVAELLRCSQEAAAAGRPAPWSLVLPLYPTSPVDPAGP
jgi:tRNA threonylcarbamoyl adenosine modification protein YeaZ